MVKYKGFFEVISLEKVFDYTTIKEFVSNFRNSLALKENLKIISLKQNPNLAKI